LNSLERSDLPIIILGLGRSGSTLLCELLNAHSRIYISDESWLFYRAALDLIDAGRDWAPGLLDSALESVAEAPAFLKGADQMRPRLRSGSLVGEVPFESDPGAIKSAWSAWLGTIYSDLAAKHGAARYGDKCPGASPFAMLIDHLLDRRCLYVWTVRHPIDLALSWMERWRDPRVLIDVLGRVHDVSRFNGTEHDAVRVIMQAYLSHVSYLRLLMENCPGRVMICRYEVLAGSPEESLSEVHSFLNETLEPKQIERAFTDRRRVSGGDPKFNHSHGIHGRSVDRWRHLDADSLAVYLEAACEFSILDCMRFLGYSEAAGELARAMRFAKAC